jgi:hypothetical protein
MILYRSVTSCGQAGAVTPERDKADKILTMKRKRSGSRAFSNRSNPTQQHSHCSPSSAFEHFNTSIESVFFSIRFARTRIVILALKKTDMIESACAVEAKLTRN